MIDVYKERTVFALQGFYYFKNLEVPEYAICYVHFHMS